ncbi:MAG TPA: DNA methyltransferase [Bacteroidales bacterium]|nr:DNA methyltransferase [Bacteroidales bacterium]
MISEAYNIDCQEYMKDIPDKFFELAIVDPPYGINGGLDNRNAIETKSGNNLRRLARKGGTEWDKETPNYYYFSELIRVSKNQIIWGGNYFIKYLDSTRCMICWDKMTYIPSMSQIELAWTSFIEHSKLVKINSNQDDRIHISQKPVQLYKWLLKNYAKPGDKIFDSHMGSQSSRIACWDGGFDYWGCELDKDYYDAGCKRFENHKLQLNLF